MHDGVVLGGRHNGRIAACYLARAGHSVAMVEATDRLGGMTSSRASLPAAPQHLISNCAIDAVYWRASTGKSSSFRWRAYAAGWVFDIAMESVGHLSGLYKYYGPQRLGDRLNGLRGALVIALLPMVYGGVYGGSNWPIFVTLDSTDSRSALWATGAVTDVFALIMVWLSELLATRSANAGVHAEDRRELAAPALVGLRE